MACAGVTVVFHLAAARGEKSIPDAFMNSVVTTRNLLDAYRQQSTGRRFVTISSFSVYSNRGTRRRLLDESSPVEIRPQQRGDAYSFAKIKQEQLVADYGRQSGFPTSSCGPVTCTVPARTPSPAGSASGPSASSSTWVAGTRFPSPTSTTVPMRSSWPA